MRDLINGLLDRAGLCGGLAAYDLRKTFATLVRSSSGDEFLAMRLLRDKIPGVGSRYINFPLEQLVMELQKHSPLTQAGGKPAKLGGQSDDDPDGGENALPAVVENEQPRAAPPPEAGIELGGDGGESNSPSKGSCPGYTTGLASSFILPGEPLLAEFRRASRFFFRHAYRRSVTAPQLFGTHSQPVEVGSG